MRLPNRLLLLGTQALRHRVGAIIRAIRPSPEPLVSAVSGRPRDLLFADLHTGRRGFAYALLFHFGLLSLVAFGVLGVPEPADEVATELPGLVFLVEEGPGGGGGGGGDESEEESAPLQVAGEDQALAALQTEEPEEDLLYDDPEVENEPEDEEDVDDAVIAPFVAAMPDQETLEGLFRDAADLLSRRAGSGSGGGGGVGQGGGIGEGNGAGIGPGTGGGFGGGAYRVGSGVEPPQLRRRITPEYTDDALSRKIEGVVILEVVILKSGRVGPARVLQGLDAGLDAKAITAVRQWTFLPGKFRGEPVDVLAEIEVEFRLL